MNPSAPGPSARIKIIRCGRCGGEGRTSPLELCQECKGSRRRAIALTEAGQPFADEMNAKLDKKGPRLLDKWPRYESGGDGIFGDPEC